MSMKKWFCRGYRLPRTSSSSLACVLAASRSAAVDAYICGGFLRAPDCRVSAWRAPDSTPVSRPFPRF